MTHAITCALLVRNAECDCKPSVPTGSLTDFLLARIAEDEEVAQAAKAERSATWTYSDGEAEAARDAERRGVGRVSAHQCVSGMGMHLRTSRQVWSEESGVRQRYMPEMDHIARHDPARVLAECAAKRQIINHAVLWNTRSDTYALGVQYGAEIVLHQLALPYADHPDYQQEWKL